MAKKNNRGCAYGIIGTIIVILGVVAAYAIIASLSNLFSNIRLGNVPFAVNMGGYILFLIIIFVLFEVMFMMLQPDGIMSGRGETEETQKRNRLIAKIVSIVCGAAAVFVIFMAANWFTGWTDEGIKDYKLIKADEFKFEEAESARVYYGTGGLGFSVTSKDGKTYELFSGVSAFNDRFEQDFENQYNYAVYVKNKLDSLGIPVKIQDAERLRNAYEVNYPTTWVYIEQLLQDKSAQSE